MDEFKTPGIMNRTLSDAAAKNDLGLLKRAIDGEFGEVTQDDIDDSLIRACLNGNVDCACCLLDKGADPDCEDLDGDTPLMLAAANDFKRIVQILLDRNCDINLTSDRGRTALHMAVWNNQIDVVRMLISAGCDLNVKDMYGDSPFLLCATKGFPEILEELINNGIEMDILNDENDSAVHCAARYGKLQCLRLLVQGNLNIDKENVWGITPLVYAVQFKNESCAIALIRGGANVNAKSTSNKKSVLHYAAENGQVKGVKTLLRYKVDVNVQDVDGNTPLMCAIFKNQPEIVQILLQHGCQADFIGRCIFGGSFTFCKPFEAAVHLGHLGIAQMLYTTGSTFDFLHCFDYCYIIRSHHKLSQWIDDVKDQPRSLSDACRIAVRTAIGHELLPKTKQLPVPNQLKLYVAFYDLSLMKDEEDAI